eukprot:Skav222835  [mRNA]  locus=scaffold1338:134845:135060:- [translate_table: standard]
MYLYSLCEDCEGRFSEEDLQRICNLVKKHLLPSPPIEGTDSAEAAEAAEAEAPQAEQDSTAVEPPTKKQKV